MDPPGQADVLARVFGTQGGTGVASIAVHGRGFLQEGTGRKGHLDRPKSRHPSPTSGFEHDTTAPPIILTLQLDTESAAFFEAARQAHFPPALNRIPAHLTLFHALPGADPDRIFAAIAPATRRPPFPVAVTGLMPLGRGVAYRLASDDLLALRAALSVPFAEVLTRQDREKFRPHITVQNKVSPQEARATLDHLASTFTPFTAQAEGLQIWRYRGGPWEALAAVSFSA